MNTVTKLPPTIYAAPGSPEAAAAIARVKAEYARNRRSKRYYQGPAVRPIASK